MATDSGAARRRITEALDLDTASRRWVCNRCGHDLGPAERNYKEGCLVYDRDPREIHMPVRSSHRVRVQSHTPSGAGSWSSTAPAAR